MAANDEIGEAFTACQVLIFYCAYPPLSEDSQTVDSGFIVQLGYS